MKTLFIDLLISCMILLFFACNNTQKEFEKAKIENTIESYQKFINDFPNSEYNKSAQENIYKLAYYKAKKQNNLESYCKYLTDYPASKFVDTIKLFVDSLRTINKKSSTFELNSFVAYMDAGGNAFMLQTFELPKPQLIDYYSDLNISEISKSNFGKEIPDKLVRFGKNIQNEFSIRSKSFPEKKYKLKFQDVAYYTQQNNKKPLFVLEYQVDFLNIQKLEVMSNVDMRELIYSSFGVDLNR